MAFSVFLSLRLVNCIVSWRPAVTDLKCLRTIYSAHLKAVEVSATGLYLFRWLGDRFFGIGNMVDIFQIFGMCPSLKDIWSS